MSHLNYTHASIDGQAGQIDITALLRATSYKGYCATEAAQAGDVYGARVPEVKSAKVPIC